ncbi:hypothetical protein Pcinc_030280 [Petrolisthes cinctipes]|uniref:Uncharacterized protein n=2 Tax=Petrolisthes cinctipes TaxID=88211 RepID=A0AAE1EZ80_PETCI|nr:hypothetical protein Pcinc_030280 [Petrolisthes cinctipes]
MAYVKCEKAMRLSACLKHDLRTTLVGQLGVGGGGVVGGGVGGNRAEVIERLQQYHIPAGAETSRRVVLVAAHQRDHGYQLLPKTTNHRNHSNLTGKMAAKCSVVLLLLACVAGSIADKEFVNKYAFTVMMESCFGGDTYDLWYAQSEKVRQACYVQPANPDIVNTAVDNVITSYKPDGSSKTPLYPRQLVDTVVKYAKYQLSNFTCQMHGLGYLKDDLSLDYQYIADELMNFTIPDDLKADLQKLGAYCRDITSCYNPNIFGKMTETEINIKRAVFYVRCDKEVRSMACMKKDIKAHLAEFDTSSMPEKDPNVLAAKLLHAFINVEGNDDLKLY